MLLIGALLAWFSSRGPEKPADVPQPRPGKQASSASDGAGRRILRLLPARADLAPGLLRRSPGHARMPHGRPSTAGDPRPVARAARAAYLAARLSGAAAAISTRISSNAWRISCRAWPRICTEHEWREHGGCSGLDDDLYFSRALELARAVDAALGARLTTLAGRDTTADEAAREREPVQPRHRRHVHAALSHPARRGRAAGAGTKCGNASTTTGLAALPAPCSTAARCSAATRAADRRSRSSAGAYDHATGRSCDRLWRDRGQHVRWSPDHARRFARLLALAGVFGDGHGARGGVVEPAGASPCCPPHGPLRIRARCISAPWVSIRRWVSAWECCLAD